MLKNLLIIAVLAAVVALPFIFRQEPPAGDWEKGDPTLVIVSPHNEAIRYEFATAFSRWHQEKFGQPVKIDWRSIGGTTEIVRYLAAEYTTASRAWWERQNKPWPAGATDIVTNDAAPPDAALAEIYAAVRKVDDAKQISCGIDLFFGGGQFDHKNIFDRGMTVEPWPANAPPPGLFSDGGVELIPERKSGEIWRAPTYFGCVVSTFGICSNLDRLKELGVTTPPNRWDDLADPKYFRQVGAADPTKSGSVAKSFEMMIHQKVHDRVMAAGFTEADIERFEKLIADKKWTPGKPAGEFTRIDEYQRSVEDGWIDGIRLVQQIGANARYFTDSASKVPIDVSIGDAAVGMSIDFYARFQVQESTGPRGEVRMTYVTPTGGSSVSCDPIGLLRGAPNRDVAVRFIQFCLTEKGQRLWCYQPGSEGGPEKFALRRLPIRRDFYPSTQPAIQAKHAEHAKHSVDALADKSVDPYTLAEGFIYRRRWTGGHFSVQRELIKAMCLDSADELREAWSAIRDAGGAANVPQAMAKLGEMPTIQLKDKQGKPVQVPLTWLNAPSIPKTYRPMDFMREWTTAFRTNYQEAAKLAREGK
jgi:ABC-type Fe3+ transport system substrate-binding protein